MRLFDFPVRAELLLPETLPFEVIGQRRAKPAPLAPRAPQREREARD